MTITTDDKIEVQELAARAYIGLDSEDAAGFAAGFADDGVFVAPYGEFVGPAAVKDFITRHIAAGKEDGVRHFLTNHVIDAHEDGARYRFYITKMNIATGPVAMWLGRKLHDSDNHLRALASASSFSVQHSGQ